MNVVYWTYPWAYQCKGGGERQMLAYSTELSKMGLNVSYYDMWNPRLESADIFHCFSVMPGVLDFCLYIKNNTNAKLVVSPNLWATIDTRDKYDVKMIESILYLADIVIVNSILEADSLSMSFGANRDKFYVVYNGYDEIFDNVQNIAHPNSKYYYDNYVVNVANIEPRKNQLLFIQALKKFGWHGKFLIVGNVRDEEYAAQCREAAGDMLVCLGELDYASNELLSVLSGAAFFAMPSQVETPSIAALEAAALGKKILITSEGSTREYFKDYAVYVNPDSLESMVDGIATVNSRNVDDLLQKHIRSKFMWRYCSENLFNIYNSLVNKY